MSAKIEAFDMWSAMESSKCQWKNYGGNILVKNICDVFTVSSCVYIDPNNPFYNQAGTVVIKNPHQSELVKSDLNWFVRGGLNLF